MNIAKGIKGIRNFLKNDGNVTGWHITTKNVYLTYDDTYTALEIIRVFSENGYTFYGWGGNSLCFDE